MGFWGVLGGAAAAVGCVVALPIAGPVGAITAVGAAVAGTVGAVAGSSIEEEIDQNEEKLKERARSAEREAKKAEDERKIERAKHEREIRKKEKENEIKEAVKRLIAVAAVGFACANCDGEIDPKEQEKINEFIDKVNSNDAIPNEAKSEIKTMNDNPPDIDIAFRKAAKLGPKIFQELEFDKIIKEVMNADGIIHEKEIEFQNKWNKLAKRWIEKNKKKE